jgi:hypothetical protein
VSKLRKDLASSRASHDVHVASVPIVVVAEAPVADWDQCSNPANSDSSDVVSKKRTFTALGCGIISRRDLTCNVSYPKVCCLIPNTMHCTCYPSVEHAYL